MGSHRRGSSDGADDARHAGGRPILAQRIGGLRRSSLRTSTEVPIAEARAVIMTGITAMLGPGPGAAALELLERARGLRAVDLNLRPRLWGSDRARELVLPLVERCDVLFASASELVTLIGGDPEGSARRCASLGAGEVDRDPRGDRCRRARPRGELARDARRCGSGDRPGGRRRCLRRRLPRGTAAGRSVCRGARGRGRGGSAHRRGPRRRGTTLGSEQVADA